MHDTVIVVPVFLESTLQRILLPLVALSAGSLIGDALHNFLGGLAIAGTFLAGSMVAYAASFAVDVTWLVPAVSLILIDSVSQYRIGLHS